MAACTSCSATSSVWPRPNCKVMMETPAALVELMRARPAISPNWRSSGAVTVWPITSGLAPGYSVCTWMVGKSTCGSADSQELEADDAGQYDRQHQQRSRHRSLDKGC